MISKMWDYGLFLSHCCALSTYKQATHAQNYNVLNALLCSGRHGE